MKKVVLLLAIMVSASFHGSAQETNKSSTRVEEKILHIKKTIKPVTTTGSTVKKSSSSSSSSSASQAWRRQQEENLLINKKVTTLEVGYKDLEGKVLDTKNDVRHLQQNDMEQNVRLGMLERTVYSPPRSNAQLLQQSTTQSESTTSTFDFERNKRNKQVFKGVVIGTLAAGAIATIICVVRNSINRSAQQPYQPPVQNNPPPSPNQPTTGTGGPATVPVIP